MKIGDEILIKARVVDFDSNPHGSAVKIEIKGHLDTITSPPVRLWIHRLDQPGVISPEDQLDTEDQKRAFRHRRHDHPDEPIEVSLEMAKNVDVLPF